MDLPDLKSLKKLADVCRKSGIKTFKSGDVEFTLSEEPLTPIRKPRTSKSQKIVEESFAPDVNLGDLTPEQLLMWSSTPNEAGEGSS